MITLTFTVDSISTVIQIYDYILIERSASDSGPFTAVAGLGPISLVAGTSQYVEIDADGTATDWYRSRYYAAPDIYSGYSDPVLGDAGDLYYNPTYPPEISYGSAQQLVLDEIRLLIGDPKDLYREYGDDAKSSIMADNKTYHLDEKGWPAAITIAGTSYTQTSDPTVNGYRYLKFSNFIDDVTTGCSGTEGIEYGVDIWYYTFRNSDRQIMEAYDNCPTPPPLNLSNATSQAYILYTAKRLLQQENWHDAIEDGAEIADEGSRYDPSPGFNFRESLLDDVNKLLDDLINSVILTGIEGVRVE